MKADDFLKNLSRFPEAEWEPIYVGYLIPTGNATPDRPYIPVDSSQLDARLEELGFKQYPLSVWFVMPRWRRTREVGGFILEDVINSETPNHGGYGRLKGHPGTSVIIEYQFFCIPYEELVDQPPEGKEADYRHIPSLGKYKLRHNPNGDIGLEAFNVAVEQLERDLATMFRVLKKSEVRCDYDN